mgnify:FL=1
MIGYVLLISSAVVMASIVYMWMKGYVPQDSPECSDGVSVMVKDIECVGGNLSLTLKNNGLFNVDGLFMKAAFKPSEEIATNNLLIEQKGGFIRPGGNGLLVEESRNEESMIFQYNKKVCDGKKQCSKKDICLGNYICKGLSGDDCLSVGYGCNNKTGICLGTAKCQDLDSGDCRILSTSPWNICGGWTQVEYYNVSAIEITPVVYMEYKNKNRFVTCSKAKIRNELEGCSVYNSSAV